MRYTQILGSGAYVPKNIVTNQMMEQIVDTSDEWIQSRTGIKSRPMSVDENTSDLAYKASLKALEDAGLKSEDIDLIIVATVTPDYVFPGVSQLLQKKLTTKAIPAFDINAACSGFVYALNVADKMIKSGAYKNALIVGAETLTKYTDYSDRNTCVLFGDGAGAMVIGQSNEDKIKNVVTYADGDDKGLLKMDGYPLKENFKTPERATPFLTMQGSEVFKFATSALPKTVNELLEGQNLTLEDLDLIVAHQANSRIIQKAAKTLKIDESKMFMNIDKRGNTSAASIPMAIDEAIKTKQLNKGDTFITVAFGAGLTWGGALITL